MDDAHRLGEAIRRGNTDALRRLLKRGANPDACDPAGNTRLHYVVWSILNIDTYKILIESGANVDAVNQYGRTPLHNAILWHGGLRVGRLFLKHGANPN